MQIYDLVPDLRPTILAAREMRDARNSLSQFLPYATVQSIKYRMGRRKRSDKTVAVRAFDAPAIPIARAGVNDLQGDLPAITPLVNLTETDLNQEFMLAQNLAGLQVDYQGPVDAAAAQAALTIDNSFEVMRGQLLSTSVVSLIAEDGDVHAVDFGVPAANKITAAAPWAVSTSAEARAVIDEFSAAAAQFHDSAGYDAGVALTSRKVANVLTAAVRYLYPNAPIGAEQVNGYLSSLNLPGIVTYDRTLRSATGAKQRVFPEGTLTFLPGTDSPVGRTEMGITQEAVQQVQNQVLTPEQAPGLTIVTLGQDNPVQRAVKGAAVGLPVLQDNEDIVILSGLVAP